jgi:type I restriction enzyme S subunit
VSQLDQVPLADLCTFQRGLTYSKSDEVEFSANGVLRANNIDLSTNKLNLREIRYISDSIKVPANKKVRPGTLLICTASGSRSHLGKVAVVEGDHDLAFGGFMGLITPNALIESRYLYYALTGEQFQEKLGSLAGGTNINNLKFKDICDFPVPLPPLEEQRRIVAVLDEAFAAIATATANAEKNLTNARDLFASELDALIAEAQTSFPTGPLINQCLGMTVGHVGPMKDRYAPDGIPFLRSQNVRPFEISFEGMMYIDNEFDSELTKSRLRPGDVAVVRTGYPGTAAVIPASLLYANCSDLVIIRPGKSLNPYFVAAFLNSNIGKRAISGKLVGAAQKHFNVGSAKQVSIPLPSLEQQAILVDRVTQFSGKSYQLANLSRTRLDQLAKLKSAILYRAFAGELTVKSPESLAA